MTLVVCLGNPDRGDDGAGPAVAAQVRARDLPGVRVRVVVDPSRLLEAWSGEPDVVVVDAVRADDQPAGTVMAIELGRQVRTPALMPSAFGGTHTLGLADAVRLAHALDALPQRLLVVGIVGRTFTLGSGLSDPVRTALDTAAAVVESTTRQRAGGAFVGLAKNFPRPGSPGRGPPRPGLGVPHEIRSFTVPSRQLDLAHGDTASLAARMSGGSRVEGG